MGDEEIEEVKPRRIFPGLAHSDMEETGDDSVEDGDDEGAGEDEENEVEDGGGQEPEGMEVDESEDKLVEVQR